MAKKLNLKALASAPMAGFRTSTETVEEWGGVTVVLKEPSPKAWGTYREILAPLATKEGEPPPNIPIPEETQLLIRADAALFIDVFLDEDSQPAFEQKDLDTVADFFGPIHARLVKKALALSLTKEDAEKKSESQKPSS